jgi:hypothetical protein
MTKIESETYRKEDAPKDGWLSLDIAVTPEGVRVESEGKNIPRPVLVRAMGDFLGEFSFAADGGIELIAEVSAYAVRKIAELQATKGKEDE